MKWKYIKSEKAIEHFFATVNVHRARKEAERQATIMEAYIATMPKGLQTHCKYGHEFAPRKPGMHSYCKICHSNKQDRRKARLKELNREHIHRIHQPTQYATQENSHSCQETATS